MRVLVACEFSGIVRDAFIARGHDAMSCDLLQTERPGPHYQGDVRDVIESGARFDLMIAHPPCTRLANSGVRWLDTPPRGRTRIEMLRDLDAAVAFYKFLRGAPVPSKAVENPIMHRYARERLHITSRQVVQPWWFGDPEFKATGFELIGLPLLKPTNMLKPPAPGTEEHRRWSRVHRSAPGPDRWKERSRSFPGMAAAMADQWGSACR